MIMGFLYGVLFLLYLLFAGTVSINELVVAGVLATPALAWAAIIRSRSSEQFVGSLADIPPLLRALVRLPSATLAVGTILARVIVTGESPGHAQLTPFRTEQLGDPSQRMRRALALLCACVAPDQFVIDLDYRKRIVILHRLCSNDEQADPRWLV